MGAIVAAVVDRWRDKEAMRCGAALEVRDKRASGCMDNKGWVDLCTSRNQNEGSSPFYAMDVRTDWNRVELSGLVGIRR